jgi:hypothetical protein
MELKLPPSDAYFKLCPVIWEVNTFLTGFSSSYSRYYFNPVKNNIAFMAAGSIWSSTLD